MLTKINKMLASMRRGPYFTEKMEMHVEETIMMVDGYDGYRRNVGVSFFYFHPLVSPLDKTRCTSVYPKGLVRRIEKM